MPAVLFVSISFTFCLSKLRFCSQFKAALLFHVQRHYIEMSAWNHNLRSYTVIEIPVLVDREALGLRKSGFLWL